MTWEARVAAAFGLGDAGWARHANPWSGWSWLVTALPRVILAVWSRVWLGGWALLPLAAALAWTWLNPRLFPPPADDRAWIRSGVLGERLWTRRDRLAIPPRRRALRHAWSGATALATLVTAVGVGRLDLATTPLGAVAVTLAKLAFVDQARRLCDALAAADPARRYVGPARTG